MSNPATGAERPKPVLDVATILWNPEGQVVHQTCVVEGDRAYAKDRRPDPFAEWWLLSECNQFGWRCPVLKIRTPSHVAALNHAAVTGGAA